MSKTIKILFFLSIFGVNLKIEKEDNERMIANTFYHII